MKTEITPDYLDTAAGRRANAILRNCVHCGFCNATCPTYQLTGDELDGPRGRIYLIKQMLEGNEPGDKTRLHLDRCLTCRNCETTCPSGVVYHGLLDIGRALVTQKTRRPLSERLKRSVLRRVLLSPKLFSLAAVFGRRLRPWLPQSLKKYMPVFARRTLSWPTATHSRKVILHRGCVQPALQPDIDIAAAIVLDRLGIQCLRPAAAACCGAISHHMDAADQARHFIRQNIDAWWPLIDSGEIEAVVSTASGCGITIRDYAEILADDPAYRDKAARVSELCRDPADLIGGEDLSVLPRPTQALRIAYHPPCTQQHGLKLNGRVESVLRTLGHELAPFTDAHLCCGSAGTYSILQKPLANRLLRNKVGHIEAALPELIATANIGCLMHLQSGTRLPVKHWLELLVLQC